MAAGFEDVLDRFALGRRQGFELEELAEPEDGVHRRAELVAGPRQELVFGQVRPGRLGLGPAQGHLDLFSLGDVLDGGGQTGELSLVVNRGGHRAHPVDASVRDG